MCTNKNCIIRLSRYKNVLYRFRDMGFVKVFSDNLADAVGVASAQVRKDFSLFGITGKKKGGYQIDNLLDKLNEILGRNEIQKVVIAGAGNIGKALMNYKGFEKEGIKIVAAFDIDSNKKNNTNIPVFPINNMENFIKKKNIKLGILAVPHTVAQSMLDIMIESGIKGVLNFAPIQLKSTSNQCIINNVNLELELENVIYFVNAMKK